MAKKKRNYNPLSMWGFWIAGFVGGAVSRLIFGPGIMWKLFKKCYGEACINMGISSFTVYGVLAGFVLGYLITIMWRKK